MKKNTLFALTASIMLTGCGSFQTPGATLKRVDLQNYKIDCSRKEEQKAFIRRHIPTLQEKYSNAFSMTSMIGIGNAAVQGTLEDDYAMFTGEQEASAKIILYQLNAYCRTPEPVPVQEAQKPAVKKAPKECLAITDKTTVEEIEKAQCTTQRFSIKEWREMNKPTTRWEATVNK
jgi:hypothetical protein